VKFLRDFFDEYLEDPLRHLRYFQSARTLIDESRLFEITGRSFVELHELAAQQAGKPRWADKNPENVIFTEAWRRLLGDRWLFIHVVRNPLDTLASIAEARFPRSIPAPLAERIELYRQYTIPGLRFADEHRERCHRLVYEQLAANPERVVSDLMEWLGEQPETGQLAFNALAHQQGLEDPKIARTRTVHADSVDRWRPALSDAEARQVWAATADLWGRIDPEHRHVTPPDEQAE
jgi:hypothetical protein